MPLPWDEDFDSGDIRRGLGDVICDCVLYGQEPPCDILWYLADTYQQALSLNRDYLLGELCCAPYHPMAIDDDTKPLINGLIDLHDFGILTMNAQPGKYRKIDNCVYEDLGGGCSHIQYGPHKTIEAHKTYEHGWWHEERHRPFLSFVLPTEDARLDKSKVFRFSDLLLDRNDVAVTVHPFLEFSKPTPAYFTVNTTFRADRCVTESRAAASESALATTTWSIDEYLKIDKERHLFDCDDGERFNRFDNWLGPYESSPVECVLSTKPLCFDVISKIWNETEFSPERVVRECLEQAGINRSFKEF